MKPEISKKGRIILFLYLTETEDKVQFKKVYRALTYLPGRTREQRNDAEKCASTVFGNGRYSKNW